MPKIEEPPQFRKIRKKRTQDFDDDKKKQEEEAKKTKLIKFLESNAFDLIMFIFIYGIAINFTVNVLYGIPFTWKFLYSWIAWGIFANMYLYEFVPSVAKIFSGDKK